MFRTRTPGTMNAEQLLALVPSLRRYARALLRDAWAADDLVQDTLERAWHRQSQFAPDTNLRAWTFSIMHNLFVGQLRRNDPIRGADDEHALDAHAAQPQGDPIMALEIMRLIALLPDDQRAVLLLVAVEEFSYSEAAQTLGVPIGTVMSRLARARERLRGWMDHQPARQSATGALRIVK